MVTLFNAHLTVEDYVEDDGPKKAYEATKRLLIEKGLVGDIYVDHYGLIRKGRDEGCDLNRIGEFNIFFREPTDERTMRDRYQEMAVATSGFDNYGMQLLGLADRVVDIFECFNPISRILPDTDVVSHLPKSLSIGTPSGRQGLHYHMQDGMHFGVLQLWKPSHERDYYCYDVLKGLLFDSFLQDFGDLDDERARALSRRFLKNESAGDFYQRLASNPDLVERVPSWVKHLKIS